MDHSLQTAFYSEIKTLIEQSRSKIYQAVNFAMVQTYWQIGKRIYEEEQNGKERADYGTFLIENLSEQLTRDFGKGFDRRNLFYMRKFYSAFPIVNALRSLLSWTHYRMIINVEDDKARLFYMNESAENHWSTRQLERQIQSLYYHRMLSVQTAEIEFAALPKDDFQLKPSDFIKGIILCSQSDETVVKYSLLNDRNQIFASRYQLVMPAKEEFARIVDTEIQLQKNENQLMEKYIQYRNNN